MNDYAHEPASLPARQIAPAPLEWIPKRYPVAMDPSAQLESTLIGQSHFANDPPST